jgi:hypothetical protein
MKQLKLININQNFKGIILKKIIFTFLMVLSSFAYAYDPSLEPKKSMEDLAKLDCSKSLQECRYYSAVEYVAFFSGCRSVLGKYEGRTITDDDWKESTDILNKWSIWKDEKLHNAVMIANNPLKERLTKDITAYLFRIPAHEAFMECERITQVKTNKNPEDMSDILQHTKNYYEWRRSLGDK